MFFKEIVINYKFFYIILGLLDPRWVEQRDRAVQEKMTQEEVYAQGNVDM